MLYLFFITVVVKKVMTKSCQTLFRKVCPRLYFACRNGVRVAVSASDEFILPAPDHRQVWSTDRIIIDRKTEYLEINVFWCHFVAANCKYTVRQLYNETDFILTKIEVLSMKQCMPSM